MKASFHGNSQILLALVMQDTAMVTATVMTGMDMGILMVMMRGESINLRGAILHIIG